MGSFEALEKLSFVPLALGADPSIGKSGRSRATGWYGVAGLFVRNRRLEGVPSFPCSSSPADLGRRRGVVGLEVPGESLALFAEGPFRLPCSRGLEAVRPRSPERLRARLVTAALAERTIATNVGA